MQLKIARLDPGGFNVIIVKLFVVGGIWLIVSLILVCQKR